MRFISNKKFDAALCGAGKSYVGGVKILDVFYPSSIEFPFPDSSESKRLTANRACKYSTNSDSANTLRHIRTNSVAMLIAICRCSNHLKSAKSNKTIRIIRGFQGVAMPSSPNSAGGILLPRGCWATYGRLQGKKSVAPPWLSLIAG